MPRATLQDRPGPAGGHPLSSPSLVALGWLFTVAAFALLVRAAAVRDPDSQLYETLSRSLEGRPWAEWVAPIWPEGRAKSGIFVEHLACSLWPAALLGRLGIARGALVANFLWYLWATSLLFRLARALAGPQAAWAAAFAWALSPLSVQALLRANHEPALTVAWLGALLCVAEPARRRWSLPLYLLLAVAIKGGLGLLIFPVTLAAQHALGERRAEPRAHRNLAARSAQGLRALGPLVAGLALAALFCGLYELWFRGVAQGSFFAGYLWSQGKGTALEQRAASWGLLTNPLYYLANALWFALPGSVAAVLDPPGATQRPARRLTLWVWAALLGPLSLMARRAVRYAFPAIALLAIPGGDALCRRFPKLRDALEQHEALLPWLLMALLLALTGARVALGR